MLLIGIIFLIQGANASVIKSADNLKNNYKLHHRIILYNDLSSYSDPGRSSQNNKKIFISKLYSADDISGYNNDKTKILRDLENTRLPQYTAKSLNIITGFSLNRAKQDELINRHKNDNVPVGSFLDTFKDEPILQTIYFTSKDLAFGYKKTIANSLQLDFNMNAIDYKNQEILWKRNMLQTERANTEAEKKNIKQETSLIFRLIVDSYKNILYVVLIIIVALYISFRYVLIKYI